MIVLDSHVTRPVKLYVTTVDAMAEALDEAAAGLDEVDATLDGVIVTVFDTVTVAVWNTEMVE